VTRVSAATLFDARGRVLDVGSGDGHQLLRLLQANRQGVSLYGLDLSRVLVGKSVAAFRNEPQPPRIVWASAERMPFADASFDRIVCQGSLDHFGDAAVFMAESARLLAPGGQLIIALQNFDSASCRISRALYRLRGVLRMNRADPSGAARPYWQIPHNHTFKGNARVMRRLGERHLQLARMYGVSMFWLLPMWRRVLRMMPARIADAMLGGADRFAYRAPSMADMLISVWVRQDERA
jgi:SAM-dependent methyltransferase